MPNRVRLALVLLWTSWTISICLMVAHSLRLGGHFWTDPSTIIGLPAALLQAALIYLVARGSNAARIILLIFILLAIPGVLALERLIVSKLFVAACATGISFLLKLVAVVTLFTPAAGQWFKSRGVPAARGQ